MTPQPAAHTPTPWEVKQDSLRHSQFYLMKRDNGCTKRIDDKAGAFSESDAKQIVRAVNAHEELVSFLNLHYGFFPLDVARKAKELIAKAGVK